MLFEISASFLCTDPCRRNKLQKEFLRITIARFLLSSKDILLKENIAQFCTELYDIVFLRKKKTRYGKLLEEVMLWQKNYLY